MRLVDRRAVEQAKDLRRAVALSLQRTQRVDLRQEGRARSLERFERQRAREVGGAREAARADEPERAERGHELRAVDQRQAFLRRELQRLETDARQRLPSLHALAAQR